MMPAGSIDNPIARRAARVVLVDRADRVLLLHGWDPARRDRPYWFTVGGGLDEGETPAQAAVRELREETGLVVGEDSLHGPLWHEITDYPFNGRWYRQDQDWFSVRVDAWEVSFDGLDVEERGTIDEYRWWSVAELMSTRERFYPAELPRLLGEILDT
jgi:8-oxo-dGTP pyrophosphatase MutT (NUDIX family)